MESISFLFTSIPAIFVLAPLLIIAITLVVLIKKSGTASVTPVAETVAQVAVPVIVATTAIADISTVTAPTVTPDVVTTPVVEVATPAAPVVATWRPAEPAPVADIQIEAPVVAPVVEMPAPVAEVVVEQAVEVVAPLVDAVVIPVTEATPAL
jgi:hypothetical protein